MKVMGLCRYIDDLGRIVIPKEYRERLNLEVGQRMEIVVVNDFIVIGKADESEVQGE